MEGLSLNQLLGGMFRSVCSANLARGAGSAEEEYLTTAVDWTERDRSACEGEEGTDGVLIASSREDLLSVRRSMLISDVLAAASGDGTGLGGAGLVSPRGWLEGIYGMGMA